MNLLLVYDKEVMSRIKLKGKREVFFHCAIGNNKGGKIELEGCLFMDK